MNFQVTVEPAAESDILAAFEWYEAQLAGLGHEFVLSLRVCFSRIERNPEMYRYALGSIKKARMDRFPFGVFYSINDEEVYVIGVFHHKRNPAEWLRRVKKWGRT